MQEQALTPFKRFIELISFDQHIYATQKQIKAIEADLAGLAEQSMALEQELEIAQRHWQAMKHEVDTKEKEMQAFGDKEKLIQHKLDTLQTAKEYGPLKKELDHVKAQQHEFETPLLQAWHQLESAERDHDAAQAIHEEKLRNVTTQIQEKDHTVHQLKAQIAELVNERSPKEVGVPAEWLSKYQAMRTKISNPVVPIEHESCSACSYHINAQDLQALRRRALLQCRQCFRLLYSPAAMESDTEPVTQ